MAAGVKLVLRCAGMAGLRSYEDPCGIARALDVIGERWALLVVRELVLGPKRFSELRAGLGGASPNVLSQRLRELEDAGVVERGGASYQLTAWGAELHPILRQLGRWGAASPARPSGELSPDALLVALETTFDAAAAGELRGPFEVQLGGAPYTLTVERAALTIRRGAPRGPVAVVVTEPATLRAVVFGDRKLAEATAEGAVELRGDLAAARKLLRSFARPPRASVARKA